MNNCERFGQLQSVRAETFKSSHRPDGKMPCPDGIFTCFALMLAGRRCVHHQWHGEVLIVHHHWQYSYWLCVCSRSKVPIAPMGDSHFARCLQGGGVFVDRGGSVTFDSCNITGNTAYDVRARAQKFPSPRWEIALLTCPTESYRLSLGICYVTSVVISHVPYFPPRGQMSTTTQAPSAPGQR